MGILNKNILQILVLGMFCFIAISHSNAQINLNDADLYESKTFTQKQITKVQSLYLDANGMASHDIFLKSKGLYPVDLNYQSVPYFVVSYSVNDVVERDGKIIPKESAKSLNLDFYVKTIKKYKAANVSYPIWDGRVYEDKNELIVGGYSSKFSERPVGKIDETGTFIPQLEGEYSDQFPILKLPAKQIIFDPFEFKLLNIMPANGKPVQEKMNSFLPVKIYGQQGEFFDNLSFELAGNATNSTIILYAITGGKKFEVANCSLKNSIIENRTEGFKPQLITGCTQPTNGNVVTFTFQGNYSKNILVRNGELYINSETKYISNTDLSKPKTIAVDGDFQDWRNIQGVSDFEGDYVSYLFKNPDTDLLEFKITNDDKYLYLYSRVAGAHGRTGKTGRYYWYSFIDVDADASTGYAPTRDDNCYFGIPIGDDCEAQFEFIGNQFVKTFFGFTGIGAEKEALSGVLELGPSYYAQKGQKGIQRESYKTEYVNRENSRFITHDYTKGTSEDIIVALSPDGSEVEVKVELAGFLKDKSGNFLMYPGRKIDIAIGVEGSSDHLGSDAWGADATAVKYGYILKNK